MAALWSLGEKSRAFWAYKDINLGWQALKHIDTCRALKSFLSAVTKLAQRCHQDIHLARAHSFYPYPEPLISSPSPPSPPPFTTKRICLATQWVIWSGADRVVALLNWGEFIDPVHCVDTDILCTRGKCQGSLILSAMHTYHNLMSSTAFLRSNLARTTEVKWPAQDKSLWNSRLMELFPKQKLLRIFTLNTLENKNVYWSAEQ